MVKTPPVPEALLKALLDYDHFIIIGHKNPDMDCLNSQLVLESMLQQMGKKTFLLSPGPFDRHEIRHHKAHFKTDVPDSLLKKNPLVVVVDCSTPDRIEPFTDKLSNCTIAVIDHHASGSDFGDIRYVFPKAFSVTFLIFHIMKTLEIAISEINAHRLLSGIAADTGFFRHVNAGRSELFSAVADLAEAGASPRDIYHDMFGDRTFTSKKFLGKLLSRTESRYDGKLLVCWETLEEHLRYGEKERDSESLYGQLLAVEGCEVVLYIRQEGEQSCSVGMRSATNSSIDVGLIAAGLGGGGHRKASGTTLNMELNKAMTTVTGILSFYLSSEPAK